jgi:hypothetical protein
MAALYCKTFRDDIEFASQNNPSACWLFFAKSDLQAGFAGDGAVISARRRKGPGGPGLTPPAFGSWRIAFNLE